MSDKQLIVGIFPSEAAADTAVESYKGWSKATDEVRLGAIGVLVLDDTGRIKEHKLGKRSTGKGAGIGLALAVIAPPTLLVGIVGGAVLGHFHHKGLQLTDADRARIGAELAGGKAAVGVLVDAADAKAVSDELTHLGGTAEAFEVTDEALEAVAAVAPADTAAPAEPVAAKA